MTKMFSFLPFHVQTKTSSFQDHSANCGSDLQQDENIERIQDNREHREAVQLKNVKVTGSDFEKDDIDVDDNQPFETIEDDTLHRKTMSMFFLNLF